MSATPRVPVVLLEDDDLDAELIAEKLESSGSRFELRRATDEASYRELLSQGDVALVLSDFSLPGYDGFAALDAARELVSGAPFIFVSGVLGEEFVIDAVRRGATDYVVKDRLHRLVPAVHRALAEAETRRMRVVAEAERDRLLVSEREAREAAEEANRMKDEFLALVSHELRTPLNAILGWATLLLDADKGAQTVTRGLETIVRNARVQARLIEDILDISRIITGKLHLQTARCTVASFVGAAVDALRPAATAKEISLELEFAENIGETIGDAERLQQVVWNLVANAVKFTPRGGRVGISVARGDGSLVIVVEDTGCGIDDELLPHVFERFRQGDGSKTRAHSGLGLGLAIVRHLVELHGGTVSASSTPGHGARFEVRLPIRATIPSTIPAAPHSERQLPAPERSPARCSLLGLRVLVVDDEADARDLVSEVLRSSGAEVTTSGCVEGALDMLSGTRPDVIISDIGMPQVDGYTFLRRVRMLGTRVPAIALTAYARDVDRAEAERAGYQYHLAKPVPPHLLVNVVAQVAGRFA